MVFIYTDLPRVNKTGKESPVLLVDYDRCPSPNTSSF